MQHAYYTPGTALLSPLTLATQSKKCRHLFLDVRAPISYCSDLQYIPYPLSPKVRYQTDPIAKSKVRS